MANNAGAITIPQKRLVEVGDAFSITKRARLDAIASVAYAQKQMAAMFDSFPTAKLFQIAEAQQRQAELITRTIKPIDDRVFTDLRRTLAIHNKTFHSVALPSQQLISSLTGWQQTFNSSVIADLKRLANQAVEFQLNFETPQFYIPESLEEAKVIETESKLLTVTIDQFGSFQIGGNKIVRANANSSRHGKLLKYLENNKGEIVSNADIKENIKVTTPQQVLKDLKKELRLLGYRLDFVRYRGQGLVYYGVIHKQ